MGALLETMGAWAAGFLTSLFFKESEHDGTKGARRTFRWSNGVAIPPNQSLNICRKAPHSRFHLVSSLIFAKHAPCFSGKH